MNHVGRLMMLTLGWTTLFAAPTTAEDGHPIPGVPFRVRRHVPWAIGIILGTLLVWVSVHPLALADEQRIRLVTDRAEAEWREGSPNRALDILDQGIRDYPHAFAIQKLRGDVLATSRRTRQAVQAYDAILRENPGALNVRWAKWSVLMRAGEEEHALAEFERIARIDADNPLAILRMAQEYRRLDRLEESVRWYKKAVEMVPEVPGWRLAFARVRFDVLDGRGARDEVNRVLKMVSPDSPEAAAARSLLSVIYGATKERGRRFEPILTDGSAAERKEWASLRADAWSLFQEGRYEEVEPIFRKILALNPGDAKAHLELGYTLLELGRCEEGMPFLEKVLTMKASDETYADTFFRIAQCLMALERWTEALDHFEILYNAAVEFEEMIRDVPVKDSMTILSKEKLATWIEKARRRVPESELRKRDAMKNLPAVDPNGQPQMTEEEYYHMIATRRLTPERLTDTRASLMGRDADFSMFRYVIAADRVMRDDLPTGTHEFMPIDPGDTFPTTQEEIYLVFGLVSASYDEMPLSAECFVETSDATSKQTPVTRDHVIMGMGDQSGYFLLPPPETGWTPGIHRCGLFVGSETSAYTHTDEIRFRLHGPRHSASPTPNPAPKDSQ